MKQARTDSDAPSNPLKEKLLDSHVEDQPLNEEASRKVKSSNTKRSRFKSSKFNKSKERLIVKMMKSNDQVDGLMSETDEEESEESSDDDGGYILMDNNYYSLAYFAFYNEPEDEDLQTSRTSSSSH